MGIIIFLWNVCCLCYLMNPTWILGKITEILSTPNHLPPTTAAVPKMSEFHRRINDRIHLTWKAHHSDADRTPFLFDNRRLHLAEHFADRKRSNWINSKTSNKRIITFVTTLTHFPIFLSLRFGFHPRTFPSRLLLDFMLCRAMRHDRTTFGYCWMK